MNLRKMLKISKNTLIILMLFITVMIIIFYNGMYKHEDLIISKSLDNMCEIKVEFSSENAWPFGPHTIHIYLKKSNELFSKKLIETQIYNDGKSLDESNCTVNWDKNICIISLNGEEQEEEIILIDCSRRERIN